MNIRNERVGIINELMRLTGDRGVFESTWRDVWAGMSIEALRETLNRYSDVQRHGFRLR